MENTYNNINKVDALKVYINTISMSRRWGAK